MSVKLIGTKTTRSHAQEAVTVSITMTLLCDLYTLG